MCTLYSVNGALLSCAGTMRANANTHTPLLVGQPCNKSCLVHCYLKKNTAWHFMQVINTHIRAGSCPALFHQQEWRENMLADGFESNEASGFVNDTPSAKCDWNTASSPPPLCPSLFVSPHSFASSSLLLFVIHHQMELWPASNGLYAPLSKKANRIYFICTASISIRANGSAGQHAAQLWA